MNCALCRFAEPYTHTPAVYIIDGQGVCEEHVDSVSGSGFDTDLLRLQSGQ
jgi:hypothetical protein